MLWIVSKGQIICFHFYIYKQVIDQIIKTPLKVGDQNQNRKAFFDFRPKK